MWLLLGKAIEYVASRFNCAERTLWRWKAQYDGTLASLQNKSSRPHSTHPLAHSREEAEKIWRVIDENPHIGLNELYGKLRHHFAYARNITSLWRFLKRNGYYEKRRNEFEKYVPQEYHTPERIGTKWQMDVKWVPRYCNIGKRQYRYYQYTVIDEATRERFIFAYTEYSALATVDFTKRAIVAFGYKPGIIQTDNGCEFTIPRGTRADYKHPFDKFCEEQGIEHKLIRAYTPRHNGKVERSHRNDQQRFYKYLHFDGLQDLRNQMAEYLARSNNIPSSALRFCRNGRSTLLSPNERRRELLLEQWGITEL